MMSEISQTMRWSEMDEAQRAVFIATFGQTEAGRVMYEGWVTDDRFNEEGLQPWDAYAEVIDGRLKLTGRTAPGGGGEAFEVIMPEDVLVEFNVWVK
jgi:hypothetical protein